MNYHPSIDPSWSAEGPLNHRQCFLYFPASNCCCWKETITYIPSPCFIVITFIHRAQVLRLILLVATTHNNKRSNRYNPPFTFFFYSLFGLFELFKSCCLSTNIYTQKGGRPPLFGAVWGSRERITQLLLHSFCCRVFPQLFRSSSSTPSPPPLFFPDRHELPQPRKLGALAGCHQSPHGG